MPFQSAPPRGGRPTRDRKFLDRQDVSIRAPARGATPTAADRRVLSHQTFQSAPPRGGRQDRPLMLRRDQIVSIRAPARGATAVFSDTCSTSNRFNPRPRAGGDVLLRAVRRRQHVSIRAPARGATGQIQQESAWNTVSIRAPARGATIGPAAFPAISTGFNPRPRAGGDPIRDRCLSQLQGFNPRPRAGGDAPPPVTSL